MKRVRLVLALGAFFVAAIVLAACGGGSGLPGNAVAKVGDQSITKTDFEHWLRVAAISAAGQTDPAVAAGTKKPDVVVPDPPDYKACIAKKAKDAPKPAKGQPKPTTTQFKQQCQQEYESFRDQVMSFLISSKWIEGEADDQGIKVTDAEVQKQFDKTKKQTFHKESDFQKFLTNSGMTLDDLKFRVRLQTLSDKLRAKVTKGKDTATSAQIQTYYNAHKKDFSQPERRDVRLVLTKSKAKADQALAAIKGGQSFKTVAKRLSVDQTTKNQGGLKLAMAKTDADNDKTFATAAFAAKKGQLKGPIKTAFGYYVFRVEKVTTASQQTLTQATATIKQLLSSQNQQKALNDFVADFRKRWQKETDCRKGYVTSDCKNAPKKSSTTSTTQTVQPGATTQNAPPANQDTATTGG
jgi:foldase protein PrsA